MDGELLLSITEPEIRNDLKITNNLLVKKLLQHVAKLKGGGYKPPATASSGQAQLRDEVNFVSKEPLANKGLPLASGIPAVQGSNTISVR